MNSGQAEVRDVLRKRLIAIEQEMSKLGAEVKAITAALISYDHPLGEAKPKRARGALSSAIRAAMEKAARPLKPMELAELVKSACPDVTSRDVRAALAYGKRKKRFRRVGQKGWVIKESADASE
jgi:hypothetical protein